MELFISMPNCTMSVFTNKVIAITGAGSGIGEALALNNENVRLVLLGVAVIVERVARAGRRGPRSEARSRRSWPWSRSSPPRSSA